MGFNFSFFGDNEHRVFNYKPRYYDPAAEERKKIFGAVDGLSDDERGAGKALDASQRGEDPLKQGGGAGTEEAAQAQERVPGSIIRGSWRDGNYQRIRKVRSGGRLLGIIGLVLFFTILYFIAKFYMLLFE